MWRTFPSVPHECHCPQIDLGYSIQCARVPSLFIAYVRNIFCYLVAVVVFRGFSEIIDLKLAAKFIPC